MIKMLTLTAMMAALVLAGEPQKPPRTPAVTGTADISVKPDICYISLGVETLHKKSAREAYKTNAELMNGVSSAVKAAGIPDKDMQTSSFSVTPEYHFEDNNHRRVFDGYHVYQALEVSVREIGRASCRERV